MHFYQTHDICYNRLVMYTLYSSCKLVNTLLHSGLNNCNSLSYSCQKDSPHHLLKSKTTAHKVKQTTVKQTVNNHIVTQCVIKQLHKQPVITLLHSL